MSEARREPRTAARLRLKIKFKSSTVEQFIERYSVDVSRGGIFIRTRDPLSVGTQIRFEFQLQDASPLFTGIGTVVWTREPDSTKTNLPPGMGVRFDSLSPESYPTLDRILAGKVSPAALNEPRPAGRFPTVPQASGREPLPASNWMETSSADALRETTRVKAYSARDHHASALDDDAADPFEEPTRIVPMVDPAKLRDSGRTQAPPPIPGPTSSTWRTIPSKVPYGAGAGFTAAPSRDSFDMVKEPSPEEVEDDNTGTHEWAMSPATCREESPFVVPDTGRRASGERPFVSGQIDVPVESPFEIPTESTDKPPLTSAAGGADPQRRTTQLPSPPTANYADGAPRRPTLPPAPAAVAPSTSGDGPLVERPLSFPESEPILLTAPRAKDAVLRRGGGGASEPRAAAPPPPDAVPAMALTSAGADELTPGVLTAPLERRPARRWPLVLVGAVAMGVVGAVGLRTLKWRPGPTAGPAPTQAPPAPPAKPPSAEDDPPGNVRIVAEAPDDAQGVPEVNGTEGGPAGAPAAMIPLEIRSTPSGADLFVDGQPTGRKTPTSVDVARNRPCDIRLSLRGFTEATQHVTPTEGQVVEVALAKMQRSARVESSPSGLAVELDGRRIGKTPLTLTGETTDFFRVHEVAVHRGRERKTAQLGPESNWTPKGAGEAIVLRLDLERPVVAASSADRRPRTEPKGGRGGAKGTDAAGEPNATTGSTTDGSTAPAGGPPTGTPPAEPAAPAEPSPQPAASAPPPAPTPPAPPAPTGDKPPTAAAAPPPAAAPKVAPAPAEVTPESPPPSPPPVKPATP